MQYIQLSNSSFILHTSKGLVTLTNRSFNFNKIKNLVDNGAEEDQILPLLEVPELSEGIFEAYELPAVNCIVVMHRSEDEKIPTYRILDGNSIAEIDINELSDSHFRGVYTSMKEVMEDFPEYVI